MRLCIQDLMCTECSLANCCIAPQLFTLEIGMNKIGATATRRKWPISKRPTGPFGERERRREDAQAARYFARFDEKTKLMRIARENRSRLVEGGDARCTEEAQKQIRRSFSFMRTANRIVVVAVGVLIEARRQVRVLYPFGPKVGTRPPCQPVAGHGDDQ